MSAENAVPAGGVQVEAIRIAHEAFVASPRAQLAPPLDKLTKRARKALLLAQAEALRFNHNYIGTEHLLLGLVAEGEGIAAKALVASGLDAKRVRNAVEYIVGRGANTVSGLADETGLTPRAARAIALAVDEARRLGHAFIGTEHLLLGLVREGEGIAAGVLESLGVGLEELRTTIGGLLASGGRPEATGAPKGNVVTCRVDDRDLEAIDALVEAGIRSTRSDAAAWLISAGIDTHQPLLTRVYATVARIRELRTEAQALSRQASISPGDLATGSPSGDDDGPAQTP